MASQGQTEKYPLEVINAGFFRGGSASLSLALRELGFGPTWHMITNPPHLVDDIGPKWWIKNVDKLNKGEPVDWDEWLQQIQCKTISDTPVVFYWDQIFKEYPKSKVIICFREFDSWSKSYMKLVEQMISFKYYGFTDAWLDTLYKTWEYGHFGDGYQGMEDFLALYNNEGPEILKRDYYDAHIEKARTIVPREQLLIFNIKEGWEPLCKFLKVPVPNKSFPNINHGRNLRKFINIFLRHRPFYRFRQKLNAYYVISIFIVITAFVALF
eukprot:453596_1